MSPKKPEHDIPVKPAGGCVRITVTVPVDVKRRMDSLKGKGPNVNWSKVAADAFKGVCDVLGAAEGLEICKGCGQKIDPECCGCGDSKKNHGSSLLVGHNFVPMGCDCYRAGRGDASGKRT